MPGAGTLTRTLSVVTWQVECVDGLFLASFVNPWDALTWALRCHQRMLMAAWPEELLKHELCEQIAVTQVSTTAKTLRSHAHPVLTL